LDFPVSGRGLLRFLSSTPARGRIKRENDKRVIRALDTVSLNFQDGDRVGLVGNNGAGKSSLLRVLAGIYQPTSGTREASGDITTMFSGSLGVNVDATGYENINLVATLLGFSKRQIENMVPEIAAFSELDEFLELPVRTYSSGMRVRLGFSIATFLRPEILLIDEVIGAGDQRFLEKSRVRLESMIDTTRIVVVASHSATVVRRFCTKGVWMDLGRVRMEGDIDEVFDAYKEYAAQKSKAAKQS
tara:strand:+ start:693 stop:1427 length:735 start_codon:yes stop_codon:yes gene_type:complete